MTAKNFVQGAIILAIAGLIAKIIGAFFRIPLVSVIGTEGIGYYSMAYPVYSLLGVVATAGIPAAISKMVAEKIAVNKPLEAHNIFKVAVRALIIIGVICSMLLFALSPLIASVIKSAPAIYSLVAISPALFFAAVISAYRGYFQGMEQMKPTALSQIIEQLFKLLLGLSLAYVFFQKTGKPEFGACGALLGISLSEVISCGYIIIYYKISKKTVAIRALNTKEKIDYKPILNKLVKLAVPVVIGACVMPIILSLDSVIVTRVLQDIGYSQRQTAALYGVLTGVVNPLINMPAILSLALAMSLVPAISSSYIKKDFETVKAKTSLGIKLAISVGMPATMGFMVFARPIISLLYKNISSSELAVGVQLLQLLSLGVLCLTFVQTTTGILQGLNKPMIPVYSLCAGAVVKVVVSLILMYIPSINIIGAAIGTLCCFLTGAVINTVFVLKYSNLKIDFYNHILKPLCSTATMIIIAWLIYSVFGVYSNTAGILLAVIFGVIVYAMVLLFSRTFLREELITLPGGEKLLKLLIKLKIF